MKTILVIRHAEKPDAEHKGVDEKRENDPTSLSTRGWQRAGALAVFFAAGKPVPYPDQIYVSAVGKEKVAPHEEVGSRSRRPLETVTPLAAKSGKEPNDEYGLGDEQDLVDAIVKLEGTTLVCWQHEAIPEIAKLIAGGGASIPERWPPDRFDVIWGFACAAAGQPWTFNQTCQDLLAVDGAKPFA